MTARIVLLMLALIPWVSPAPAQIRLPDIGDPAAAAITPYQEHQLGEEFMRNAREHLHIIDDPLLNDYLHDLGQRLVSNSDDAGKTFTFFLVNDPTINAFAVPGGFIGVDSGLILMTRSESQLAAVLSHEIAHITQHHMARTIAEAGRMNLPTAAALLAAILLSTQSGELGGAAIAATQAGALQHQINFTRGNEEEADRVGIGILERSDFDPYSMATFFERMEQASRYEEDRTAAFLRDHPVTSERIAEARDRAAHYPKRHYLDRLAYYLARARLRALVSQDPARTAQEYQKRIASGQYEVTAAADYGYALALSRAGRYDAALARIAKLLQNDPDRVEYLLARGETQLAAGRTRAALETYAYTARLYPDYYPLTIQYANALMQGGRPERARNLLLAYLRDAQPDPMLYSLLARAASQAGFTSESHEFQAEYYRLNGQLHAAIQQLEQALKSAKSEFQHERIAARLAQFKREAKDGH